MNSNAIAVDGNVQVPNAQIIPFRFEEQQVRTLLIDDQPWFVAADVCHALAVRNNRDALSRLDDDEKGVANTDTLGGSQSVGIINESGLYSLILTSRKAEAKRFKKWVTAEVLPAIRKHGRYEDSRGVMGTLIGETIGTNGFNMLGGLIKGKVVSLPTAMQRRATAKIWSQTHAAFGVRSAADIPADKLDAARNFIAAYALEGEWLGKAEKTDDSAMTLSLAEASTLYSMMSHLHFAMHEAWYINLAGIATSLRSASLVGIAEHLREVKPKFKVLDSRRAELYTAYLLNNGGNEGGYAKRA